MSSTDQNAAPAASENTPLLADQDHDPRDAETSDSTHDQNTGDDDNDDTAPRDILTPRSRTFFLSLLFATLLLSAGFSGLIIAAFTMLHYGRNRFGVYDYQIDGPFTVMIIVTGLTGVGHAVYNIIRLHQHKLSKLPSKRLLLVACACLSTAAAIGLAPFYLDLDNWYCNRDRLDGPWYPGTWEQCKRWESAYMAVTFSLVVALGLNAILSFVFILTAFSIARSRTPAPNPNWTISPGYFSFEFSLHWGGANPHQQRQRQLQSNGTEVQGNGTDQGAGEQA